MAVLNRLVDERVWTHRQRSTSIAGIATGATSLGEDFVDGIRGLFFGIAIGSLLVGLA